MSRVDVLELRARVAGTMTRNDRGRLRITSLRVRLEPVVPADQRDRMARCVELYEDFCLVSQSVRQGIDITAEVHPADAAEPAAV
jgi:organic hydroperoxide reductase OsmC/OhrA